MSFDGQTLLKDILKQKPEVSLDLYPGCVILRRQDDYGRHVEHAIDPAALGAVLSAKLSLSTGLLGGNTLSVSRVGASWIVSEFRPGQMTGIWLEGSEQPLRIPLPGLVLIRKVVAGNTNYKLYAVRERPTKMDAPLFEPPLPNVHSHNAICWGTVKKVSESMLGGTDLSEDWTLFLGTPFNGHAVADKSRAFKKDVRQMYVQLERDSATGWPLDDLIQLPKLTLGMALEHMGVDHG